MTVISLRCLRVRATMPPFALRPAGLVLKPMQFRYSPARLSTISMWPLFQRQT